MPVTNEQVIDAFRKSGKPFTTDMVVACIEHDIRPDESPLMAAARQQSERDALDRQANADAGEMSQKELREKHIRSQFSALSGGGL